MWLDSYVQAAAAQLDTDRRAVNLSGVDHEGNALRGCVIGLLLSLAFWGLVALVCVFSGGG